MFKNTFLKEKYFVKENEMFWNYLSSKWNLQILINYLIDVSNLPRDYGSYWKISPTPPQPFSHQTRAYHCLPIIN
jgi:hypothetical protein